MTLNNISTGSTGLPNARKLPAWKSSMSCRSPCSICRTSATSAMKVWCWTGLSIFRASTPDLDLGPERIIPSLPRPPLEVTLLCIFGVPLLGGKVSKGTELTGVELVMELEPKVEATSFPSLGFLGSPVTHWDPKDCIQLVFLPSGALTTNLRIPGLGGGPSCPGVPGVLWAAKGVRQQWREAQGQAMQTSAGKQNVSKPTKQKEIIGEKKSMQILNVT